jgi:hypothetical protein
MSVKLRKNANKTEWSESDLPNLFKRMREEIAELEQAVAEGNSIDILLESCDAANFAMFIAATAMRRGVR